MSEIKIFIKSIFILSIIFYGCLIIFSNTEEIRKYNKNGESNKNYKSSELLYESPRNCKSSELLYESLMRTHNYYSYMYPMWEYDFSSKICSISISDDGELFVAINQEGRISLFSSSYLSNRLIWTFNAPESNYFGHVSMSASGDYFAAEYGDTVYFFNKISQVPVWSYNTTESIEDLVISSDGNYIATITKFGNEPYYQGKIYFFNRTIMSIKTPMWNYTFENTIPNSITISGNGNYTAVGGKDVRRNIYDTLYLFNNSISNDKQPMWSYQFFNIHIYDIDMDSNASKIVVADDSGVISYFNTTQSLPECFTTSFANVYCIDISPDSKYLIGGCLNQSIHVQKTLVNINTEILASEFACNVSVTDTGLFTCVERYKNCITWYNNSINFGNHNFWYYQTNSPITSMKTSNNGEFTVVGCSDSKILLFNNLVHLPTHFNLNILSFSSPNTEGIIYLVLNLYSRPTYADNYSIYEYRTNIIQINNSLNIIENGIRNPFEGNTPYIVSGLSSGKYYIRVIAYNQYGYTLSSQVDSPVIVSLSPGDLKLSSTAEDPDPDGIFTLDWNNSNDAESYTVFKCSNYINKINGSLEQIGIGLTSNSLLINGYGKGEYYFIVVAINEIGITQSNCLKISVFNKDAKLTRDISIISLIVSCVNFPVTTLLSPFLGPYIKKKFEDRQKRSARSQQDSNKNKYK